MVNFSVCNVFVSDLFRFLNVLLVNNYRIVYNFFVGYCRVVRDVYIRKVVFEYFFFV